MALRSPFGRRQALALLALGALASPSPLVRAAGAPAEAPRVSGEEIVKMAGKGEAVIVDVRNKTDYDFEHAAGAVSIPLAELATRMGELPRDKYIAAYCT